MTPEQKLKHLILLKQASWKDFKLPDVVNAENVDQIYEDAEADNGNGWGLQDSRSEVRAGEVETHLYTPPSRHYESSSVAAKYIDGSWVGWTYWYGGGKHGEPEAIDWMDDACDLDCTEEVAAVTKQTFVKRM